MGSQEPLTAGAWEDARSRRAMSEEHAQGEGPFPRPTHRGHGALDRLPEPSRRGLSSPSLRDLAIIAERLDIGIADLFDGCDPQPEGAKGHDAVVGRARRSLLQRWRGSASSPSRHSAESEECPLA
jgi:hypothetical protein